MPLQATSGAASYDAFGGGAAAVPVFIEDVFSTYLYTGNGSTQTITNNIDLSTKGGMVWIKQRSSAGGQRLTDTVRGATKSLASNSTAAQQTETTGLTAFGTTGFTVGADADYNTNTSTYASWTFREQPKFFDVVTFTQTSTSSNFRVNHSLGSVPGCIIIKCTSTTSGWYVYHRSLGRSQYMRLEATSNAVSSTDIWGTSDPTSTDFGINAGSLLEGVGTTYVAYLYAHDAGGFGLTGTDNVISCGSYTTDGSGYGSFVDLGYEPQWILTKKTNGTSDWTITDSMRDLPAYRSAASITFHKTLFPNTSGAEAGNAYTEITPTGFYSAGDASSTYIYIAIRRGPMKVPTSGASVFYSAAFGDIQTSFSTGFATDFAINKVTYYNPDQGTYQSGTNQITPRLTGLQGLQTNTTNAEGGTGVAGWDIQDGYKWANGSGYDIFGWAFKRAPSFADVFCYTGTGATNAQTHNLGVSPEMVITKSRSGAFNWSVYIPALNRNNLLTTAAGTTSGGQVSVSSTTVTFSAAAGNTWNGSGSTYIAYLFATCAGVSKVGSYTGTGSTQTIDCGFTNGARFILIKRTDSTGAWFVYDSNRGIQAGNDPYLVLNDSAAAILNTNYVDTDSTGFQVIGTGLNVNAATYIFLAIA